MRSVTRNWLIVAAVAAVGAQLLAVGAVVSIDRERSELQSLGLTRDGLRGEIASLEGRREELRQVEARLQDAAAELEAAEGRRLEAEKRAERLSVTAEGLEERIEALRRDAADGEAAVRLLESRQAAAADRVAELESAAAALQRTQTAERATLVPIEEQAAATEKRAAEARAAWAKAIGDLEKAETDLAGKRAELAALETAARLAGESAAAAESRVSVLAKRESELTASIERDRIAAERAAAERRTAEASLAELKSAIDAAAAELAEKRGRLASVLETINQAVRRQGAVSGPVEPEAAPINPQDPAVNDAPPGDEGAVQPNSSIDGQGR